MSCYQPIEAYQSLEKNEFGVYDIKWTHQGMNELSTGEDEEQKNSIWEKGGIKYKKILLPCNKCEGCKMDYSKEKAKRIELESKYTQENYFVTLTYNEENIPKNGYIETLCKEDTTKFIDRLKKQIQRNYGLKLEFLLAGEYGEQTERPHYHAILLNCPIKDRKGLIAENEKTYYSSEWLTKLWGLGQVMIGECNPKSIAYTARYCMKKAFEKDKPGREPIFVTQSKSLGKKYYLEHKEELLKNDSVIVGQDEVQIPKYYVKLAKDEGENLDQLKERREIESRAYIKQYMKEHNCKTVHEMRECQRREFLFNMNKKKRQ